MSLIKRHPMFLGVVAHTLPLMTAGTLTSAANAEEPVVATMLEEIVVTAQKRTESLQDTPIAISAFGAEALEQMGAQSAADIGEFTPNATLTPSLGSKFNIRMSIRGLGTAEPSLAIDPKVGIYLDGAYIARNAGSVFDVVDLERVEVLRGPQGTLWGKNTTGGAVNMVTSKPSGDLGFKQQLSGGSDGYYRSVTTLDTPTVANTAAKLSYVRKGTDGWAKNINPSAEKELGSEDTEAYRVAVRWDATDSITVDYAYDHTNGEAVSVPVQVANASSVAAANPAISIRDGSTYAVIDTGNIFSYMESIANGKDRLETFDADGQGKEHVEISGHNLTVAWALDEVELKSISAYREYDSIVTSLDSDGINFTGTSGASRPGFHSSNVKSQQQFSQEFQAVGSAMDSRLNYVLGLYYFEEDGKEINPWHVTFNSAYGNILYAGTYGAFYNIESQSEAIYGQFSYDVDDRLTLTLGLRYTEDDKELTLLDADPMLTADESAKESWSEFTSAFTANYQLNEEISLYAKVAEGFASGVFNPGTIDRSPITPITTEYALSPVDPEETTSYEIGLKSMLLDSRLQLNGAVFYNDNQNLQITDFVNGSRISLNSGESEATGVEIEVIAMPLPGLRINANYGYLDTDNDDKALFQTSPKSTGSLGAQYEVPLDIALMTTRLDISHTGKSFFSSSDKTVSGGERTLVNARVTLSEISAGNGDVKVALWGKNLTDKEYRLHGANFGFYTAYSWGDPRSAGIDVTYEF